MEMLTTLIKAEVGLGGQQFTPVCVFYCNFTAVCSKACIETQPFTCIMFKGSVHWSYYLFSFSVINYIYLQLISTILL